MENNNEFMEMVTCDFCGKEHPADDMREVDGKNLCQECFEDNTSFCDCCGKVIWNDDVFSYGYDVYCEDCFIDNFTTCDDCGDIVPNDDIYHTANGDCVCRDCRYDNYTFCENCGELYHNDYIRYSHDDSAYCDSCYDEIGVDTIRNYSYKPAPIFYGSYPWSGDIFFGVELEVDKGGESYRNAGQILDIMNECTEHIYCKHDGSLEDGFEIVSHPATLEYHCNSMAWAEAMEKAVSLGYRSHNTDSCGLHVHVSRSGLGNTYEEQENTIAKIVFFVEKHWDYLVRFTRRTLSQLDDWASRYGIEPTIADTYEKAKGDYCRYRAVNLLNHNTIEFRIFRGTLKHSTFIATLQLVSEICSYCKVLSLDAIEDATWNDFVGGISEDYTELHNYLITRGICNV